MKTIGLIGGMSWESSTHYYRLHNEAVKARRQHAPGEKEAHIVPGRRPRDHTAM